MENLRKLAILGKQDPTWRQTKQQHNTCWTPLYANKHK